MNFIFFDIFVTRFRTLIKTSKNENSRDYQFSTNSKLSETAKISVDQSFENGTALLNLPFLEPKLELPYYVTLVVTADKTKRPDSYSQNDLTRRRNSNEKSKGKI